MVMTGAAAGLFQGHAGRQRTGLLTPADNLRCCMAAGKACQGYVPPTAKALRQAVAGRAFFHRRRIWPTGWSACWGCRSAMRTTSPGSVVALAEQNGLRPAGPDAGADAIRSCEHHVGRLTFWAWKILVIRGNVLWRNRTCPSARAGGPLKKGSSGMKTRRRYLPCARPSACPVVWTGEPVPHRSKSNGDAVRVSMSVDGLSPWPRPVPLGLGAALWSPRGASGCDRGGVLAGCDRPASPCATCLLTAAPYPRDGHQHPQNAQ